MGISNGSVQVFCCCCFLNLSSKQIDSLEDLKLMDETTQVDGFAGQALKRPHMHPSVFRPEFSLKGKVELSRTGRNSRTSHGGGIDDVLVCQMICHRLTSIWTTFPSGSVTQLTELIRISSTAHVPLSTTTFVSCCSFERGSATLFLNFLLNMTTSCCAGSEVR